MLKIKLNKKSVTNFKIVCSLVIKKKTKKRGIEEACSRAKVEDRPE